MAKLRRGACRNFVRRLAVVSRIISSVAAAGTACQTSVRLDAPATRAMPFSRGGYMVGWPKMPRCLRRSIAVWGLLAIGLCAGGNAAETDRGSSGTAYRKEAIAAMPLDQLSPEQREKVHSVLRKTSVYRRMPSAVVQCDAELHHFVLNHPEILANIWQLMEIENVVLQSTGPNTYRADDGDGTKGEVEFLYRGGDTYLIFARGSYDGPLFTQPITGTCVLLVRSSYAKSSDGHDKVTTQLDSFVHLDNVGLDFLAKTFQPLVCRVADYNFLVTASFIEALSRTAEVNQMGIQRLASNLRELDPAVRERFSQLAAEVGMRAQARSELAAEPRARLAREAPR